MSRRRRAGREGVHATELIAKKRDGGELTDEEIRLLVREYVAGGVPDYQMSAFAMAVYFQGMSVRETVALTLAMRDSGTVVHWKKLNAVPVDKHSTGGVGDKVSICLAPIVASCGVAVPMVSGRALGHTGGTLDKLEAIPGFRTNLDVETFESVVQKLGCALIGQTEDIAPADRALYALRDVTATVESVPLITASILSKKLAEGIEGLVLDVKVGRGAFMKTVDDARELARSLVRVGRLAGKRVTAVLTNMSSPLGRAVGNALETAEAFEVLHGGGPDDLVECTYTLGAEMLRLGKVAPNARAARAMMDKAVRSGAAAARMRALIEAQGGDPRVVDEPDRLPRANRRLAVQADSTGWIRSIDALTIAHTSMQLGAGRATVNDRIDPSVGIVLCRKPGEKVVHGEELAIIHAREHGDAERLRSALLAAFDITRTRRRSSDLVIEILRK